MNEDFRDLLAALLDVQAQFLIVGAFAVAAHGFPRATGDLDIWILPNSENAERVWLALLAFGAPVAALGVRVDDLKCPGTVIQIGIAPRRIDLLTSLTGLTFTEVWSERTVVQIDGLELPILGRAALIKNKLALGRARDLADVESLESLNPAAPG